MRVLVVSNLYPPETIGGYEAQCSQAVEQLLSAGHDVLVLTSIPRRAIVGSPAHVRRVLRTPDVYSPERVPIRSPNWEFESNLLQPENVHLLLQALSEFRPDVCYLWNLVAIGGVGLVGTLERLGVPWVWHLGDAVPSVLCNFDGAVLRRLGRTMGAVFSGRFIACSSTVVDRVEEIVPIRARTRIIPNWVRSDGPDPERVYRQGGPLRMVFAGRLSEEKGVLLLPPILAQLREWGYDDVSLDILGTGMEGPMQSLIDECGVSGQVVLHGWQPPDQVRRTLLASDVLVFPTFWQDAMPLAALEAASVGCVPVIPWQSGVSEWLADGVTCIKAERSATGYAGAIRRVLDGELDLAAIGRRGARTVHEDLSVDVVFPDVEAELVLASRTVRPESEKMEKVYRTALLGDAVLRRYVAERSVAGDTAR